MRGIYTLFTGKKRNFYVLFLLLCLFLYLPASFFRAPIPPDELRTIHIAQSITSFKTALIPVYLGQTYYDKPPLYFWIIKILLPLSWFNYLFFPALFNVLAAWVILSMNYAFFKNAGAENIGVYSSFFLATTVVFYGMSALLRMDMLFLCFIFLSIFYFWKAEGKNTAAYLVLAAVFSFLAVFTKGALGIIFPLFIESVISILAKDKKALVKTIGINLGVAAACFIWIFSFTHFIDGEYFSKMVIDQTLSRGVGGASHAFLRVRSAFFYLPFLFLLFLPWSFLGIGYFAKLKREKLCFWEKVYLWWFGGGFLILSLLRSKMEMYLLLLAIPFCALIAKFFLEAKDKFKRKLLYATGGFFAFAVTAAFIYSKIAGEFMPSFAPAVVALFLIGLISIVKKSAAVQVRNFFISWILFLQIASLFAMPMVADYSELKKIVSKINSLDVKVDKIYSTDRLHLLLPAYKDFKKEVVYWEKETCPPDKCVLISLYEMTTCRGNEVAQVGVNHFYYHKK